MVTGYERSAVVTHLAECAVCRKVALTVIEFQEQAAHDAEWQPVAQASEPAAVETREKRWSSEKTRAPAVALAFAVLLAVVAIPLLDLFFKPPHRAPVETLASAAAGQRPTSARVSGGFAFAPPPREPAYSLPERSPLLLAAKRVRRDYAEDFAPTSRRAVGVAALLAGDPNAAVASLSVAMLAAPNEGQVANDLAAAYFERARRLGSTDDLLPALDAAERAVRMQPALLEAWFNRALIITALGLRLEARAAWQDYLGRDASSRWAEEARQHEEQLASAESSADWLDLEHAFARDPDHETARAMVARHPSQTRELFERRLAEWTAAARSGADDPQARAGIGVLGDAFWQVQRERFYQAVASSVARASTARQRRFLAAAHVAFNEARALSIGEDPLRANRAFARAAVLLKAADSPLALRAEIEALTATYYMRRYDEAASNLPALRTAARGRDYRVIATRASWILGLVEFARADLAAARIAYEATLDGARLPADLDQFVNANVLLANLHEVLGANEKAWSHRIAAMRHVDELATSAAAVNLFLSAAGQSLVAGHYGAALLFQSRALRSAGLQPVSEIQTRTQRARTFIQLRDYSAAQAELDRARQRLPALKGASLRTRQEVDLLEVESHLLQRSQPAEALRVAARGLETARRTDDRFRISRLQLRVAESSLAVGDLDGADVAVSQGVATLEAVRAQATSDTDDVSDYERPLYTTAAQIAIRRGDVARAFAFTERARLRSFEQSPGQVSVLSLPRVQQRLDEGTALAILNQLADQVHIWIITRDDVVVHSADLTASRAAGLVLAQWQELSQGASMPRIGAQLFDAVIRPVLPHLRRAGTVVFVADGPYRQVAFAGLYDRERERYLVEDFRLMAAPSASSFVRSGPDPRAPRRGEERFAMVAAASRSAAAQQWSPPVASALAALYESAQVKSAESATPTEILTQIAERDVVHISTPVAGRGDSRETTMLVAADEAGRSYSGALSALRLAAAKTVRARLVTLDTRSEDAAAAGTGGSQEVARALLAAGVTTVVGSVGAPVAANLDRTWIEFHRRYAAGAPAAESLQRAQLAALGASNRRPGPWAALTVFGSNQ
jgi:hypothetical protein